MPVKIWISKEKEDDKIIAYLNETIYKANPPLAEIEANATGLKTQNTLSKHFFGIPLRYISEIFLQEGKNYIEILFRGDTEHLMVNDEKVRNEIFEFFKQNIPGAAFSILKQSKLQSAKKPLIAMGVIAGIFLWSYLVSASLESGDEYELSARSGRSLGGVVLVLASLGTTRLTLIFASLFAIAGYSFIRQYRTPVVKHTLTLKQNKV